MIPESARDAIIMQPARSDFFKLKLEYIFKICIEYHTIIAKPIATKGNKKLSIKTKDKNLANNFC